VGPKRIAPLVAERAGFAHKKRIRAAHVWRNNKYKKRAAARIALTCMIGQPGRVGVRKIYDRKENNARAWRILL
jgi:hypothetical protein